MMPNEFIVSDRIQKKKKKELQNLLSNYTCRLISITFSLVLTCSLSCTCCALKSEASPFFIRLFVGLIKTSIWWSIILSNVTFSAYST